VGRARRARFFVLEGGARGRAACGRCSRLWPRTT